MRPHPILRPPLAPTRGAVQFVYVANSGSNSISGYWVKANGALVPVRGSPFATGSTPESVTIDPGGKFLYVGVFNVGIYAYAIDPATGALGPVKGSPFDSGRGPRDIVIDPTDEVAYENDLNSGTISAYAINTMSGALTLLPGSPFSIGHPPMRIVLNPKRRLAYVVADGSIETFSTAGGALTLVGRSPKVPWLGNDIAIDHQAKFVYMSNEWTKKIYVYVVSVTVGTPTLRAGPPVRAGLGPRDILIDRKDRFLYVSNVAYPHGGVSGYAINPNNGALTSLSWSPLTRAGNGPQGMAITPSGTFVYATNFTSKSVSGYAINTKTGAFAAVPGSPFRTGDFPWGVTTCRRTGRSCKPQPL